jgi:heparan-alpha-glucosaminide N-acetyltransferase
VGTPPPGLRPVGEVYPGWLGHWNNGTNIAAAFDRWLLNLLPRSEPYLGNAHGYHTLQFVPLVAQALAGVVVGRLLAQGASQRKVAARFALIGVIGLACSGLLDVTLAPLVKSLWTPTWAVFSSSVCLLLLAALLLVFERPRLRWLFHPLVALGSNAILLYVLSYRDRWRFVLLWERLLGPPLSSASMRPVLESLLVLLSLWLLAHALDRYRIHVRV